MDIREIGMEQICELKDLVNKIFSLPPWNDHWETEQLYQYANEQIANPFALVFGLYQEEKLIGFSWGRIKHWFEGTEYFIDDLGIDPEYQGNGNGKMFLELIEEALKKKYQL